MKSSIDFVVPWVDGSDPAWLAEKQQYRENPGSDSGEERYRDWDLFHYWFRSIEMYAPWVRKVFLITWGHVPKWLNLEHPKLVVVNHRDYIPAEYLPTFNSHTIELNLHRIPGLAEQFVYFNDDVYLTNPTKPEDFFLDGSPRDAACLGQIRNRDTVSFMPYIMLNMMGILNEHFSKNQVVKRNPRKWFNLKYRRGLLMNLYLAPYGFFTGFKAFHIYQPFLKSSYLAAWEKFASHMDATCRNKFRGKEQVNQYLIRYLQLISGSFTPIALDGKYLTLSKAEMNSIRGALLKPKYRACCINDDPTGDDFHILQSAAKEIFELAFPKKSSFEIATNSMDSGNDGKEDN